MRRIATPCQLGQKTHGRGILNETSLHASWRMQPLSDTPTNSRSSRPPPIARYEQAFPTLTPQEIERLRRFGEVRRFADGETLFETGQPRAMHVVLSGHVIASQRDGLGHVTPILDFGPGQFLAEVGSLSGEPSLVDAHAEGEVEALVIPPERPAPPADRRSRTRRAHHARADPAPGIADRERRRRHVIIGPANVESMWRGSRIS